MFFLPRKIIGRGDMLKRPFFKLSGPRLSYSSIKEDVSVSKIDLPPKAILLLEKDKIQPGELYGYKGKTLRTGQKVDLNKTSFISSVTGTVTDVSEYTGYLNRRYYALSIETTEDEWEEISKDYVPISIPGFRNMGSLFEYNPPVNQVMIMGLDTDLLVTTNQLALRSSLEEIKKGIRYIHEVAKIGKVSFVIPAELVSYIENIGYKIFTVSPRYPNAIPKLIIKNLLNKTVPPGKETKDMGIEFVSSEAVANMGHLFEGKLVFDKLITIIKKDYSTTYVKARIGTPVGYLLNLLGMDVAAGDRVIIGGPMRGKIIYSLDRPVDYDTDAIFIQDRDEVISASDTHCINCGECVKVCPVNVPVNMLVRVLENGLFEEAAEEYGLLSCIECGLCSYVCVAQIPVFHYIMLGKYELSKMREENV